MDSRRFCVIGALLLVSIQLVYAQTCPGGPFTCSTCSGDNGCGWCSDSNGVGKCVLGSSSGPTTGQCNSWSFAQGAEPICNDDFLFDHCDCNCCMGLSTCTPKFVGSVRNDQCFSSNSKPNSQSCSSLCASSYPQFCTTSTLSGKQDSVCKAGLVDGLALGYIIAIAIGAVLIVSLFVVCCCCQTCCLYQALWNLMGCLCPCLCCWCRPREPETTFIVVQQQMPAQYGAVPAVYYQQPPPQQGMIYPQVVAAGTSVQQQGGVYYQQPMQGGYTPM